MTNNNFNSNDFSNGCEGLENGSEQTFDKMAESVDKANVEGVSSSIEENRFDKQTKETNSKDNTNFSLPTTLKDYLIFSRNFYSGFWVRFIAYIIDLIVVAALAGLLNTYSFGLLNRELYFPILGEEGLSYVLVMFSYFILVTYYFSQTLGKMIMKIKVETNKGTKLKLSDVLYREVIGRLLTIALFYIPYIVVAFTDKKKGLHDYIADTVVVKEDFSSIRRQMNERLENMKQEG